MSMSKIAIEDIAREITQNKLTVKMIAEKCKVSENTVLRKMKAASKEKTT